MTLKRVGIGLQIAALTLLIAGSYGCAKKSYIDVDYRLPSNSGILTGRTVFVETRDLRRDREIFNQRAEDKFKHFTGLFSLSLIMPDNREKVLGAYELPMLFETAISRRLQKLGVKVSAEPSTGIPVFQIKLNRFRINLIGQKWQAEVSYEASLAQDTQMVAREVVTGSAERFRVVGSSGAEKVIGEIFTEIINQLNIERLFAQAKL